MTPTRLESRGFSENKGLCGVLSPAQFRKPGLSHCYEGIFDLFVQPAGNCTRNHGTIIIASKLVYLVVLWLPFCKPGHAFGHTPGLPSTTPTPSCIFYATSRNLFANGLADN